jgi:hypothetical protein
LSVKVAVTEVAAAIVKVQVVAVPLHAPPQPAKLEVASAVAVRVTVVPGAKPVMQVAPQVRPAGLDVTVPVPVPVRLTVKTTGLRLKPAVTARSASIVTVQVPVPLQAPLQPAKLDVPSGVAVRVTTAPAAKASVQSAPQAMPAGLEVTVPLPSPDRPTVSVRGRRAKAASTTIARSTVTAQVPVPLQPPPVQPAKVDVASAVAVNVTSVPAG